MNKKYNTLLLSGAVSILSALLGHIAWDWIAGVNASREVVKQLQFRSIYLYGDLNAAPVTHPEWHPATRYKIRLAKVSASVLPWRSCVSSSGRS